MAELKYECNACKNNVFCGLFDRVYKVVNNANKLNTDAADIAVDILVKCKHHEMEE